MPKYERLRDTPLHSGSFSGECHFGEKPSFVDGTDQCDGAVCPRDPSRQCGGAACQADAFCILRWDVPRRSFEGLCVGHAPRKCAVCGKWFLTTDARHTKYCSGYAPNDRRGRTCRQVGNLRGREQRELAADHPIKKIYTKRFNTITQYLGRGTLDEQTAAMMKALAKASWKRRCKTMTMRRAAMPPRWSRRLCWQK